MAEKHSKLLMTDEMSTGNNYAGRLSGVLVAYLLIFSLTGLCSDWPDCKFQCQAGDVSVSRVWLGDSAGRELPSCEYQRAVNAYLWVQFDNNANSPRYAVILLADVYVNGELRQSLYDDGLCVLDQISPKSSASLPVYSASWNCGDEIKLTRLVLSWETAKDTSCSNARRKCSNRNTKCYGGSDIEIVAQAPLTADFSFEGRICPGTAVLFSEKTTGGVSPYKFLWDFGDGGSSNLENPSHEYATAGSYAVMLTASDASGKVTTAQKPLTVEQCSCIIDGQDHPCSTKTEIYSALLDDLTWSRLTWTIDGLVVGIIEGDDKGDEGESISIDWSNYGIGLHELALVASSSTPQGQVETARCNMIVDVIEVPTATISMVV